MRNGLAKTTLKMYDSAWSHFSSFCATLSVAVLPVNVSCVSAFIVHCYESRKMQPSSIKSMVAGIQFHLRCLDPSTTSLLGNPSIRLLINGLKKEKPQGNDQRLPLTLSLLLKLISRLREGCFGSYTDLMLESALLTAFYGFLRGGEFTTRTDIFNSSQDLTISDVTIYSHYFTVYLKHSKTDKNKEGTVIFISESNSVLFCPVFHVGLLEKPSTSWSAGPIVFHRGGKTYVQSLVCLPSPPSLPILWSFPRTLHSSFSAHRGCYDCSFLHFCLYLEGHGAMVFSCL